MTPIDTTPIEGADSKAAGRSPASRQAALVCDLLGAVLLKLEKHPGRIDRAPIVMAIESALTSSTALVESKVTAPDHLDKLDRAHAAVRRARQAVEHGVRSEPGARMVKRLFAAQRALEHCRDATIDSVVAVQDVAARQPRTAIAEATPFVSSAGTPRLHAIEREPLQTGVEVAAPDEWIFDDVDVDPDAMQVGEEADDALDASDPALEVETVGAHDAEPDPAKRLQVLAPLTEMAREPLMATGLDGELAQLERIARDCLEEIAVLGNLRGGCEPFDLEAMAGFEQRLLNSVDALIALGTGFELSARAGARYRGWSVLEYVVSWGRDAPALDPGRAFARALVLGSVDGKDSLRTAILTLKQSHPETFPVQARALALAPHPGIDAAMIALCADDDPKLCALAFEVLAARGCAALGAVMSVLEHPFAEVRLAAARCAGEIDNEAAQHARVVEVLTELVNAEVDDEVTVAAIESLIAIGSRVGLSLLRERLAEEAEEEVLLPVAKERLMLLLAMAGGASDAELLSRLYMKRPAETAALGRHGHVSLVAPLMNALSVGDELITGLPARRAAARALQRITGAVTVADDSTEVDNDEIPSNESFWRSWWSQHGDDFDPEVRYRFGQPYTALASIEELLQDRVAVAERERCAVELRLLRNAPAIRVDNFLQRQRQQIQVALDAANADLESPAPRMPPGSWAERLFR